MLTSHSLLLPLALLGLAPAVAAPVDCAAGADLTIDGLGTPSEELARLADLLPGALAPESGLLRRGALSRRRVCAGAPATPWDARFVAAPDSERVLDIVPPRVLSAFRTLDPGGANDSLLWQGRGFSSMLSGGVAARLGIFSFQLAPQVAWSQNRYFTIVPTGLGGDLASSSAFYGSSLDLPQRFGPHGFVRASLGQSFLQVEGLGMAFGISTENRWWGPGIRNSLLLSNNAEGFPHVYLGTSQPAETRIGAFEAQLLWGALSRTRYFADRSSQAYTAFALTYQPIFAPGLYLGLGRSYVESGEVLRKDLFLSALQPPGNYGRNFRQNNQLLSLWMRWVMPASNFELYGEWARDDTATAAGFIRTFDRTAAWTAGIQKLFPAGSRWVRVVAEASQTRDYIPSSYNSFYTHSDNVGYTNAGQLLGAAIGPGADSQYFGVDLFTSGGRVGASVERVRRNEEYFSQVIVPAQPGRGAQHDVEMVGMLRQVFFVGSFELSWEAGGGFRWNRDFLWNEQVYRAQVSVAIPLGGPAARNGVSGAR